LDPDPDPYYFIKELFFKGSVRFSIFWILNGFFYTIKLLWVGDFGTVLKYVLVMIAKFVRRKFFEFAYAEHALENVFGG
jgi:hypothetical protein